MLARCAVASVASCATAIVACSEIRKADAPPDASSDAAVTELDASDESSASDAPSDADAGPPADFACAEPWTKANKTKPECAARRVALVEANQLGVRYVSIARTPTGRVGVLSNAALVEQDDLHLSHFVESAAWPPRFDKVVDSVGFDQHIGVDARLFVGTADVLHVVELEYSGAGPGDVTYMSLVGGALTFSPRSVVAGAPAGARVSGAISQAGTITAAWYAPQSGDAGPLGAIRTAVRPPNGSFGGVATLESDLVASPAGVGASSLAVDQAGSAHLVVDYARASFASSPTYYTSSGTSWTTRKTIDNPGAIADLVGYNPSIAVSGTRKLATYFARASGATTAQLRLATWELANETPQIEIVAQGIAAPDPTKPMYAAAMTVDPWGIVHVAVVLPAALPNQATLEYRRQVRPGNGSPWLVDVVDDDVLGNDERAFVDIFVDPRGRSHIAYRSAKDYGIYYATRLDR